MKDIILVTGGAGFVGSNLIRLLVNKTNKKIISLDNYSSGSKRNHILSNKVKYVVGNTYEIEKKISKYTKKIHSVFHFGEFARIYQSFKKFDECFKSNSIGSNAVFNFCLENDINCHLFLMLDIHKLNPYELSFINEKMSKVSKELKLNNFRIEQNIRDYKENTRCILSILMK